MRFAFALPLLLAIAAVPALAADAPRSERVNFHDKTSVTIESEITGGELRDYIVDGRQGQMMQVVITPTNPATLPCFNILPPMMGGEVVFDGCDEGDEWASGLTAEGAWTVRVYQLGADRDAGARAPYKLVIDLQ